jgi:hypothetical protein
MKLNKIAEINQEEFDLLFEYDSIFKLPRSYTNFIIN